MIQTEFCSSTYLADWPEIAVKICVQSQNHKDDTVVKDICDHAHNNICCHGLANPSVPFYMKSVYFTLDLLQNLITYSLTQSFLRRPPPPPLPPPPPPFSSS